MTHLTARCVCLTASLLTGSANPIEYMVHSGYFDPQRLLREEQLRFER